MENKVQYVVQSLELHLFFARIMKEHALFLEAGFPPPNADFAREAENFKRKFEELLLETVQLSNGLVSEKVLCSGEVVTEFTEKAERQTAHLTGIGICTDITRLESRLRCGEPVNVCPEKVHKVRHLNQKAIRLLNGLIAFKEKTLSLVLSCRMFTMNYPLLIEHIIREAKLYRTYVLSFENDRDCDCQNMRQIEQFWNQIMMEHALFIRGLLDPSEDQLVNTANEFADDYARLLNAACDTQAQTFRNGVASPLEETLKFRDFKAAGTKGIQDCKIRSIILPLLADHVLREANHYLRLLGD